ncbi:hypothetical protein M2394_000075 [Pseudomonas sp. BIGb0164]|jgi:hypothetical protein|nr:hypothetical protein [Pseudomonas sp. BIGb0164]
MSYLIARLLTTLRLVLLPASQRSVLRLIGACH